MKPVYYKLVGATLTVFILDIIMVVIKILKIKIDITILFVVVFLLLSPVVVIISSFLGRGYEKAEENNDPLFIGILSFLALLFFFILWKFS